jgi:OmpA-OmpF porin, OOP family
MKKIFLAGAVVAMFVAAPVFAQGYVGLGVGSSSAAGFDFGNVAGGNTSKGMVKIFGGFQFTPNWGAEVQYSDLGNRNITQAGVNVGSYKANQFSIAGTGTLPLNSGFSLLGKLGVSANKANGSNAVVGSGNATSLMIGVGAAYNITPALSVRVEYEDFGKIANRGSSNVRASGYSVSLKYGF